MDAFYEEEDEEEEEEEETETVEGSRLEEVTEAEEETEAEEVSENEAEISVLNEELLILKERVLHLEARIKSLLMNSATKSTKSIEAYDMALKSKINNMEKDLLCFNEELKSGKLQSPTGSPWLVLNKQVA